MVIVCAFGGLALYLSYSQAVVSCADTPVPRIPEDGGILLQSSLRNLHEELRLIQLQSLVGCLQSLAPRVSGEAK